VWNFELLIKSCNLLDCQLRDIAFSIIPAAKTSHDYNNKFRKGAKSLKLYGARIKNQMKFGSDINDMMKS
jgi:hypothetical protein